LGVSSLGKGGIDDQRGGETRSKVKKGVYLKEIPESDTNGLLKGSRVVRLGGVRGEITLTKVFLSADFEGNSSWLGKAFTSCRWKGGRFRKDT